jgi:hypothetical protein
LLLSVKFTHLFTIAASKKMSSNKTISGIAIDDGRKYRRRNKADI